MIACASPSGKNAEESLNCLRYANRTKNIQNKATVNVDPHSRLVNTLRGQVVSQIVVSVVIILEILHGNVWFSLPVTWCQMMINVTKTSLPYWRMWAESSS